MSTLLSSYQLRHRLRWLRQMVACPKVGVIGGYHCGNLGDMALGTVCATFLRRSGIDAGLQTIYSLKNWPTCQFAVLGGGAIGYGGALRNLLDKYGMTPERVAFVGVDFNDDAATLEAADFLKKAAVITCRSQTQARRLQQLINRTDVTFHSDLTFGFPAFAPCAPSQTTRTQRILGVNCTNFFWLKSGRGYVSGSKWNSEIQQRSPQLINWISRLGPRYVESLASLFEQARKEGWQIWHVPFTPRDDHFARYFFPDSIDRFIPYSPNPFRTLRIFHRFSRFFPSRFHSLAFALVTSTPVLPFCYAEKSEQLCVDFDLDASLQITALDLMAEPEKLARAWESPVLVGDDALLRAKRSVSAALQMICDTIKGRI